MTYHIFVSGRVQGVGYRRYAQKTAENLALPGWTRNLLDGRVEIFVTGEEKTLDQYCDQLRKGPSFSQVHEVIVKVVQETLKVEKFEIRPDAEMK